MKIVTCTFSLLANLRAAGLFRFSFLVADILLFPTLSGDGPSPRIPDAQATA
ncbi:MAG: hypothetical protein LBR22_01880 [Desulfovibrio sp.]|nr:hypothetical protein [Desulfovibrio sp.]